MTTFWMWNVCKILLGWKTRLKSLLFSGNCVISMADIAIDISLPFKLRDPEAYYLNSYKNCYFISQFNIAI